MDANIFVDIASENVISEGNVASLSEFFRQYINRSSDADIHTKPAVVLIEDDLLRIFSTNATFRFETATGDISYKIWKTERSETDIFESCFDNDIRYVAEHYRRDASPVILALTAIFINFFGDGKDGLSETVQTLSKGKFDYDKNKKGDWMFWYRNNGEWHRSSLCLFTDYLYNTSRSIMKYEQSDEYLSTRLSKKENYHTGYLFVGYANFIASNM